MNNSFDYDSNGKAVPKVQSARKLSNGQWYINGRLVDYNSLTPEQKQTAKAIQQAHNTALPAKPAKQSPASLRQKALKKLSSIKKSLYKSPNNE